MVEVPHANMVVGHYLNVPDKNLEDTLGVRTCQGQMAEVDRDSVDMVVCYCYTARAMTSVGDSGIWV